ncbi:DUF6319 family protein [Salinifilum ghardaiensis]
MGRALSDDELATLRSELAAGNTPTVWFTSEAVGVTEGRSGKVMDLGEPAEGDFIQVRPAGSKDVLSFSAGEVTTERPPRKRSSGGDGGRGGSAGSSGTPASGKASTGRSTAASGARGSGGTSGASRGATSAGASGSGAERASGGATKRSAAISSGAASSGASPSGAASARSGQQAAAQQKTSAKSGGQEGGGSSGGARSGQRRQRSTPGAVVTLTADAEGQWHVEVTSGKKRVLRATPVPPSAVAQAAHALHDDVAAAVEPVLEAARERQRARVEQLQQELDSARRLLEDLDGQQS